MPTDKGSHVRPIFCYVQSNGNFIWQRSFQEDIVIHIQTLSQREECKAISNTQGFWVTGKRMLISHPFSSHFPFLSSIMSGAHHLECPSPISLRDNLCPDWAICRIVSRECLSPLRSAYDRNQRRNGKWSRKTGEGCGTSLRALVAICFSVDFSHVQTAVETEIRGKRV